MIRLVEPDDRAIRTVRDLLMYGEPFSGLPAAFRLCLRDSLEPVGAKTLTELPSTTRSHFDLFFKLLPPIESCESPATFAAEVLMMFWKRRSAWEPLWCDDQTWQTVMTNLLRIAGDKLGSSCERWRTDQSVAFEAFALEVLLPGIKFGSLVDWNLCADLLEVGRRTRVARQISSQEFTDRVLHPVFWLRTAMSAESAPNPTPHSTESPLTKVLSEFEPKFRDCILAGNWRGSMEMLRALEVTLDFSGRDANGNGWRAYGTSLVSWFRIVDTQPPLAMQHRDARFIWFRLATRCFGHTYGSLSFEGSEAIKSRVLDEGLKLLGQFRADLKQLGRGCELEFFHEVLDAVRSFGSWWQCTKPLLLALRELREPAVAADLRYWGEAGKEPPPEPLHTVAQWIANMLGNPALAKAREAEPGLDTMRTEFASYCLSRLKTKDGVPSGECLTKPVDTDFMEPNPIWRACYARAARELRVNHRGKSHRIALWSSLHDPSPEVREASRQLYDTLRHQSPLDPGLSPRRPLLAAYWWLRQAHLLALGLEVDPDGARRTRTKELRWTDRFFEGNPPTMPEPTTS